MAQPRGSDLSFRVTTTLRVGRLEDSQWLCDNLGDPDTAGEEGNKSGRITEEGKKNPFWAKEDRYRNLFLNGNARDQNISSEVFPREVRSFRWTKTTSLKGIRTRSCI